ncbi:urease accessory protein UreD [Cohnella nanjingensis]|uniref:Urease accessory protein UreD n=1 Tax=Cohnella nanjingensis TaxID=1387779 RepID=A0A7X0RUH8_9BACL|nr:urease accessory protein UreD [Cohnella nanjingensis]MBB6673919.1 urease accessory protein UreD [Cohnella nanjingensis]
MRPRSDRDGTASPIFARPDNGPTAAAAATKPPPSGSAVLAELRAAATMSGGRPALAERYHTAPLKIAKTFDLDDTPVPALGVVQMDVSPGLLDGDRYRFDWRLDPGARVYATNQAYTRVHPCPDAAATVEQRFRLGADAVLEWMPEPVMLYRDANYICDTEIELARNAVCIVSEVFCPGRISRGECFDFASYDTRMRVTYEGELVHYQRQRWQPEFMPLTSPGCFGDYTHVGTLGAFGDRIGQKTADAVHDALEAAMPGETNVVWSVAATARFGLVVMAAGRRGWELQRLLLAAWDALRLILWGAAPRRLLKEAWMNE